MNTNSQTPIPSHGPNFRKWVLAAILLPLLSMTTLVRAQITNVIYQDSFARSGPLNGSMPDTDATGAKYTAGPLVYTGNWTDQNGSNENACYFSNSIPAVEGPLYNIALLPITVETGHIYTATASILVNTNYTVWWMFLAFDTCPSLNAVQNNWFAGTLIRSTNNPGGNANIQNFAAAGTGSGASFNITPSGTPWNPQFITFTIVLNLTNPAAITATWYTNGVQIRTVNLGSNIPGANNGMWPRYVTFGQSNCGGYVTNFIFTDIIPAPSAPTIVEQPNNLVAPQGQTATFWVNAVSTPDPGYQWMSNGVAITGATNASFTTPPLTTAYSGASYSVAITNVAGSVTSSPATLTVVAGNPTVYSATKTLSPTSIVVNFSGPVDPVTSQNAANYRLNNGASVDSVNAGSVPSSVVLTTSTLDPNAAYYLTVQNVQDSFGDAMAAASTNAVLPAGLVLDLKGDSGVQVDASGNAVQWLDQTTNGNNASDFFGWSQSTSGLSLPGTTTRPATNTIINGLPTLTFTAANDTFLQAASTPSVSINTNITIYCVANVSDLAVSQRHLISKNVGNQPGSYELDGNNINSSGLVGPNFGSGAGGSGAVSVTSSSGGSLTAPHVFAATRALVTTFTNVWSPTNVAYPPAQTNWFFTASNIVSVYLDGVQTRSNVAVNEGAPGCSDGLEPVYIGTREDHAAGAIMNGQIAEILVFNTALSPADMTNVDNYLGVKWFTFSFLNPTPTITTSNGFAVAISPEPSAGSTHLSYQWQENGTNIPGATGPSYTTGTLAPSDNGDTFSLIVTLFTGVTYTNTTTLNVLTEPPYVMSAYIPIWTTNSVLVFFDEAMDPTTGTTAANYSLNNGASVLSAAMGNAPNEVVLTTSALRPWNAVPVTYSLTVSGVQDLYGNTIVTASTPVAFYPTNIVIWVRADTGVTTDAGTNSVNQWNDLSGNNNNFYQGGGPGLEPTLVTNAWGDPVIRFGANSTATNTMVAFQSSTVGITGDISVIAAMNFRLLAGGRSGEIISKTGTSTHGNIAAPYDCYVGNTAGLFRGNGAGTVNGVNYGSFSASIGPTLGYPCVVAMSETGNQVSHYLDGKAAGTGLLSNGYQETNDFDAGQSVWIGARSDFFNHLAGDMSELIVVGSSITSSDIAAIDNYLSTQHNFVLFNPNPTNIVASFRTNQMTLSWPADHTGWQLQSNSVGLTASGSWFIVSGSSLTNQITFTPDVTQTNVFYRMFFQQP